MVRHGAPPLHTIPAPGRESVARNAQPHSVGSLVGDRKPRRLCAWRQNQAMETDAVGDVLERQPWRGGVADPSSMAPGGVDEQALRAVPHNQDEVIEAPLGVLRGQDFRAGEYWFTRFERVPNPRRERVKAWPSRGVDAVPDAQGIERHRDVRGVEIRWRGPPGPVDEPL